MALVHPAPASARAGEVLATFGEHGDLVVHVRHQAGSGMEIHAAVTDTATYLGRQEECRQAPSVLLSSRKESP